MSYTFRVIGFLFQNSRNEPKFKDSLSNGLFMDTLSEKSYYFIGNFLVTMCAHYKALVSQSVLGQSQGSKWEQRGDIT